jgi:NADPH2:quinone reductase
VSSSPERGERLLALGADQVVADVEAAEGPFELVLESVGGASLTAALSRLAPRGKLVWFGQASREPGTLHFSVAASAPFASIELFIYWRMGASDADDLATLVRLVAAGHLHPEVGLVADWRETPDALIALRERRVRGNAVLTVG